MLDITYNLSTEFIVKVIPFCYTKQLVDEITEERQYEGRIEIWVQKDLEEEKKSISVYISDNPDDTLEWHDFANLTEAKDFVEKWISEN